MNNIRKLVFLTLITATLLASCGGQAVPSSTSTPDINAILTESVGTFSAYFYQTQTAMVPPATSTPLNTPTSIATSTPLSLPSPLPPAAATQAIIITPIVYPSVTGTQYTATPNPSALASGCNNLGWLRDESVPDGTVLKPGETFTKTWKVANTGTCDWVYLYRLAFVSGDSMGGDPAKLGKVIPPGKWTQISIQLRAPEEPGTYTGSWRLSDGAGHAFGSTLGVSIVVKNPTSYP